MAEQRRTSVAAIVGPTAAGKTELALQVAHDLDAEIVSVDSMQIYRGMDIGTDKAMPAMRAAVPHHLLDLMEPDHPLTVSEYQELGRAAIDDISSRERTPLLVGGSGLYLRAIVDDLRFPPRAPDVRAELEAEAERAGPEALHARLAELDPRAAARIEPGNARRTVRALEVIRITGRPFSENEAWDSYDSIYELSIAGITRRREELYARVAARVDSMLERGLVDEVKALDGRLGSTARQALGYKQILDAPDATEEGWRAAIVRATKRFARRQESWFGADPRIRWFEAPVVPDELTGYLRGEA
ncbi:MAG: tRNA (adenosine(37)-N6)-dimethylallyltransferase MiaA [Actinomycetota bacterium]